MAKAGVEVACTSDSHTDEVLGLLKEKLSTLSLVVDITVPKGTIVANPAVSAKSQNQQRKQPAAPFAPTTKKNSQHAKKRQKEMKQQKKAAKKDAIG